MTEAELAEQMGGWLEVRPFDCHADDSVSDAHCRYIGYGVLPYGADGRNVSARTHVR